MFSPNDGSRIVLLPCDREIIELSGMTEAEYRDFVRYCRKQSRSEPGKPQASLAPAAAAAGFNPLVAIGLAILSVGLSIGANYLLRPRVKGSRGTAPDVRQQAVQGTDITSGRRFAPKSGFDSTQSVVELGTTIPLVYARRETLNGVTYGGVRVNTNLLWSQILSLGGDQLFRGIFLIGEGDNRADSMELDAQQFALGNNLLGGYSLETNTTSRISLYYMSAGGRITGNENIAGRTAASDPGNFENPPRNGPDVFSVAGAGNVQGEGFCYCYKPSTQTSFGLFGWVGNGVCYRTNPSLRPARTPTTRAQGDGNFRVVCNDDVQERARRLKDQHRFVSRAGVTAGPTNLVVGSEVTYRLDPALSFAGTFDATGQGQTATITGSDGNSAIAARQQSFDENIVEGELYKIGSAYAICIERTGQPFAAAVDGGNQEVTATFRVVEAGTMSAPPNTTGDQNASLISQIFRVSRASFITEYPCQVVEVGLRSTLGINVSGLTNVIEAGFHYENIDQQSCEILPPGSNPQFPTIGINQSYPSMQRVAGSVSTPETRYSCFRLAYRRAGSDEAFTQFPSLFATRSESNQALYTYLRVEMPQTARWEFQLSPVSAWEVRESNDDLQVLDPKVGAILSPAAAGVTVRFNGVEVDNEIASFQLLWFQPNTAPGQANSPLSFDANNDMGDSYARLAEVLPYNEVTTSFGGNPEHEVVYINSILPNPTPPQYDDLAIIGMNIRASREFANLSQFSVYMNRGLGGFHDFPSVLRDLLTNERYGVGEIVSPEQIDDASFNTATTWTTDRRYFFDGALTAPFNIRDWGIDTARAFLLDLVIANGRFSLRPLLEFDGPEVITGLFTAGNILQDSFQLSYFDQEQRQAPQVSVKWRQEATTGDANNRGLFPVTREITVREADTDINAPRESLDMSDFCTSEVHAIDRAKFECRIRRLSTHSVKFTTTVDQAALELGKCFRLGMETLTFAQPQNGYISEEGTVTSWPALPDGQHVVVAWDGQNYAETTINVTNGRSNTRRGSVFCVANDVFRTQTYKVQTLAFNEEGNIEVEAIHWPTDTAGNSELVANWNGGADVWSIEGALN